jgi:hypothetical protein
LPPGWKVNNHPHSGWLDVALKGAIKNSQWLNGLFQKGIAMGDGFLKTIEPAQLVHYTVYIYIT